MGTRTPETKPKRDARHIRQRKRLAQGGVGSVSRPKNAKMKQVKVIDLFCGIGGLSYGLRKEKLDIVAGIDNDESCRFGYEYNNKAKFIYKDILDVSAHEINRLFGKRNEAIRVLVGCAPCQPFSKLNLSRVTRKQLEPLEKFAYLIWETLPDIVSMENVAGLARKGKYPVFKTFINTLEECGYEIDYKVVDASDYGVPQRRKRLVLLASRFGEIKLIDKTHENKKITVRDVISNLDPIGDGEVHPCDSLHRTRKLNQINLKRIRATPHDGGNSKSWRKSLMLDCHRKISGKTYQSSVYGRMRWNEPAPTMTTQCIGIGNGRFGHPEQDRAISLREAAIFQTFPKGYKFVDPKKPVIVGNVVKFIGNAVPVELGAVIGKSIKTHLKQYVKYQF